MLQANELLYGILKTLGKIEVNTRGGKGGGAPGGAPAAGGIKDKISILSNLGPSLIAFGRVKPKDIKSFFRFIDEFLLMGKKAGKGDGLQNLAKSLTTLSQGLPGLATGLDALSKIKEKQVLRAIQGLRLLYDFMEDKGSASSTAKVNRAVKTFEKIGASLQKIAKPVKDISLGFAYLGVGILAFAGSLVLTAMLLKLSKPTDVLMFLGVTVLALLVMFGMLALANKFVKTGTKTIAEMGLGMVALSLGIISFALTLYLLPKILGSESGGSILKSLLLMVTIVAAMALMFTILSFMEPVTKKGFISILWMTAGLAVLSIALLGLAEVAKLLSQGGLSSIGKSKDEKDEGKKAIISGLGMMGIIVLAAVALFAILGIPGFSTLLKSGAITMMLMGGALIVMALSLSQLVKVGKELSGDDIGTVLTHLIGGTIDGFIGGLASLSEGKKGVPGLLAFMKNSAKIFAGVGVLMAMSLALSMFAKAVSAFAELENMRIIEGYDKDGKPIFGEKVNLTKVADNISYSISTFLTALLNSTDKLTKDKAVAIRKMGRALTGKRGILSAVIQFADAMKIYAQFGEKNEIGYVDYDDKGNEIHKKVSANTVVDNMIGSFLYFTNRLFDTSDKEFGDGEEHEAGISGKQKRRMKRMSKALVGRNGILGAVVQFSEVLSMFSQFGPNNEIPLMDKDGKPIMENGKVKTLSMTQISQNIVTALTTFSDELAKGLENSKPKDAKKAIAKYSDIIEEISKFSESLTGLEKATDTISNLAKSISDLSISLDGFDQTKLSKLAAISVSAGGSPTPGVSGGGSTAEKLNEKTKAIKESSAVSPNWDLISAQIGESVGAKLVDAMKKGQMKFEFSPSSPGKGVLSFD